MLFALQLLTIDIINPKMPIVNAIIIMMVDVFKSNSSVLRVLTPMTVRANARVVILGPVNILKRVSFIVFSIPALYHNRGELLKFGLK